MDSPGKRVALGEDDPLQQPVTPLEPGHPILPDVDAGLLQLLFFLL